MPGLEQLPFAEVWFRAIDERTLLEASAAARALGKSGLEVWTTDKTPEVAAFLEARGYEEVRRYVISELDVAVAPEPGRPVSRSSPSPSAPTSHVRSSRSRSSRTAT